jgi:suppressor of tumorigenicity protein 13
MEHNRKYERKREEKEIKARKERLRKAKEEYERAKSVSILDDIQTISVKINK